MAKKFACGDVVDGCGWSTTAQNEEELFAQISKHAKDAHGMSDIPNEVIQKVKSKIIDV